MRWERESQGQSKKTLSLKDSTLGTSLVTQWLRLCTPHVRGLGLIPIHVRPHIPQLKIPHATTNTRHGQINKFFFLIRSLKKKKTVLQCQSSVKGRSYKDHRGWEVGSIPRPQSVLEDLLQTHRIQEPQPLQGSGG